MRDEQTLERLGQQYDRIMDRMDQLEPSDPEWLELYQLAAAIISALNKAYESDMEVYKQEATIQLERDKLEIQTELKEKEIKMERRARGWGIGAWLLGAGLTVGANIAMFVFGFAFQDEARQPQWFQNMRDTARNLIPPKIK